MTLEKLALYMSQYILEHWQTILIQIFAIIGTIITTTWFIAKSWYTREIKIQKQDNDLNKKSFEQEIKFLNNQLEQSKSYAKGVIEILNQRNLATEQELKRLQNANETLTKEMRKIQQLKSHYKDFQIDSKNINNKDLENIKKYILHLLDDDPDNQGNYFKFNFNTNINYYTENKENFLKLLNSMIYIIYFQHEKFTETKIKLNNVLKEKNSLYNDYIQSCKTIIMPISNISTKEIFKKLSFDELNKLLKHKIKKQRKR